MKKIKFLVLFSLLFTKNLYAWYSLDKIENFYWDIYDNIEIYEKNIYDYDLYNWADKQSLAWLLNEWVLFKDSELTACFKDGLTYEDYQKIVNSENEVSIFKSNITNECIENLKITQIWKYIELVKEYDNYVKAKSQRKLKNIQSIWETSIYADWNLTNSSFDLMQDLQNIDYIIFEREEYLPYNGVNIDYKKWLELLKENKNLSEITQELVIDNKKTNSTDLTDNENKGQENNLPDLSAYTTFNNQVCAVDNSWLSQESINSLFAWNNEDTPQSQTPSQEESWDDEAAGTISTSNQEDTQSDYKEVTDENIWPCNDFFCIEFSVEKWTQNLFTGFTNKMPGIDTLIKKSNTHLQKWANTSLAQSHMSTNNFELSFDNLKFSDMLNWNIFISTKSVPILDLPGSIKKAEDELSSLNMLKKAYESIWLDYDKQNDIEALHSSTFEEYLVSTSKWIKFWVFAEKMKDLNTYENSLVEKYDQITNQVDKKILSGNLEWFNDNFAELQWQTSLLNEYASDLFSLVKELDKIPVK